MKNFLLIIICSFSFNIGMAQSDTTGNECSTPDIDTTEFKQLPWFDNNQFLENFLDSIGYPAAGLGNRIVEAPRVRFWIPVKFWIYRDDNGNGGPTQFEIQRMIDKLNRIYNQQNNSLIGFYMKCEPAYINNSQHLIKTFVGASLLLAANREFGCFNVHVVDQLQFAVGLALKPLGACIVNRQTYLNDDNYTLPHEIGHLLGLIHTHIFWDWQIKCFKESVSRTRTWPTFNLCFGNRIRSKRVCESTGDGLSDTQADPRLLSNFTCNYTEVGSDLWGDSYTNPPNGPQESPNTHNVMSYQGLDACVDQFSRLQIGVMLYNLNISNGANGAVWRNPIYTFDDFEPDNNPEMTNPISLRTRNIFINEIQERNFHQQWNRIGVPVGYTTQCDVDWVRFVAPCNINLFLLTTELPAYSNLKANTRLTLFAANGTTQLAQNDNISATNLFSSINWNFIAGQIYFIRVENMTPLYTGYYQLRFSGSNATYGINGTSTVCTQSLFNVTNLPVGSTVLWGPSPSPLISIATNAQQQATVSKIASGDLILTASVQTAACGTTLSTLISRPIRVGGYSSGDYPISGPTSSCKNTTLYFSTLALPGATNYDWFWPTGWTNASGQGTRNFSIRTNSTSGQVGVRVASVCDAGGSPSIRFVQVNTGCGASFIISPNPSEGEVNIIPNEADNSFIKAAKRTTTKIYQIILTDQSGITRRRYSYTPGILTAKINVADLRRGIYTIRIYDGSTWVTQKLIKQ